MLANFLGKSKPINFIILLSVFVCLFITASFSLFYATPFSMHLLLKVTGFLLFYLVILFFFNFIVTKNKLTRDNSYALLIFMVFLSYFLILSTNFKTLAMLLLYSLFLRKLYSLKSQKQTLQKLYDSGLWLGVLVLLEPFTFIFCTLIFIATFLHKKPIINNLIAPIVGFLTPMILYSAYCFWFDKLYLFTNIFYFDTFHNFVFNPINGYYWIVIGVLLLALASIFIKSPSVFSVNNTFKKSWTLLISNLVIAVVFALYLPNKNNVELLFLLLPAAIIVANGLESLRSNLIKNILIIFFLASAVFLPIVL